MEYIKLGKSDLNVSKICLGCMSFGEASSDFHTWTLDQSQTDEIIKRALELGINFLIQQMDMEKELVRFS